MTILEQYKAQIKGLYDKKQKIHMDLNLSYPRLSLSNEEATITAVYSHMFQIEEHRNGVANRHTVPYTELITRQVVIKELEKAEK